MNTSNNSSRASTLSFRIVSIALAFCIEAVLLCILASSVQTVSCTTLPDPKPVVSEFFTALCEGESEKCDALLANYSSLGLDVSIASEYKAKLFDMLKESYSFELSDEIEIEGVTAIESVSLTHLNLSLLEGELAKKAYSLADHDTIRNQQDNELVAQEIEMAMNNALRLFEDNIEDYYITQKIEVNLVYENGQWLIVLDDSLYNAIIGRGEIAAE